MAALTIDPNIKLEHGAKPPRVPLDPKYLHDWTITRTAFLSSCPAFAHVLYTMMAVKGSSDLAYFVNHPAIPCAATDDRYLFINPEKFFSYTLGERVFIIAHEILHAILQHCATGNALRKRNKVVNQQGDELPYDHDCMNIALDLVINDILVVAGIGKFSKDWLHDTNLGKADDSALDVYHRVYKRMQQNGGKGGGATSGGQQRFDEHLDPGSGDDQSPEEAQQQRSPTEWATAVAAGVASAKAQGKLPAGLERLLGDVVEPKVNWKDHIRALFARKVGAGGYDWRRPDRRLITRSDPIYAPGRSGHGAGFIGVGVDTSGSIGDKQVEAFLAEVSGILTELSPRCVFVVWCDAKVHRVDELTDPSDVETVRCKGAPGGGGTDFRPVFDWFNEAGIELDAMVYLTDGYGTFQDSVPDYPVIWGSITDPGAVAYPYGDVVHIQLD
jgi:predicted metal-dependent peptidase